MTRSEFNVRRATDADRAAIVDLCRSSLGWKPDDPNERFFAWKHDENPFGTSPSWVAEADGRSLGVRVFLRWRFRSPDGHVLRAVRAVDTATHPDAQGRGIFTRLTLDALPDLRDDGVDFIFNTPNDKSRPGYLKMGWAEVGRVPVAVRVASIGRLSAVAGARAAADKWSQPSAFGVSAPDAFADDDEVASMLAVSSSSGRVSTDRDIAYLRWRYSFDALHYRVVPVGDSIAAGAVVFRLRRRGTALEATISELAAPSPSAARSTIGSILRATGADYAIAAGGPELLRAGFVPAPPLGPVLTWKPIVRTGVPNMSELGFGLGDVELF